MISIHNIFHKKMKIKLQEWEQKEKEILNLKPIAYKNTIFDENQKLEKEESKAILQDITPRENESLLKIGGFLFAIRHNIESLDLELDLNREKVQALLKIITLQWGGKKENKF
ncbi:hypothetical protein LW135_04450 [Helicobacter sp. faydin-H20]|uniref:hypothetical protein n=1 Tax=Helicobacter anatolicus TaxID=2905874 RepID=UPI001E5A3872|nr:hypothetical protein [Helicobacter anatolicus]MCE3037075.1 hypothetical protein [Helicobacter anatolicus]